MGVAKPLPGIFTFQRMLLVSLQTVGGLAVGETPVAKGPRQAGQFSSEGDAARSSVPPSNSARRKRVVMQGELVCKWMRIGNAISIDACGLYFFFGSATSTA